MDTVGNGDDVKFGFPALAFCQFCDSCGPQIILSVIYESKSNFEPRCYVPRETSCKSCTIPGIPFTSIDEKLYRDLRHSCIYSLTAESPLAKYSTYLDQDGWRLMHHFVVKDIYGRATIRRVSIVIYSVYQRSLDVAHMASLLTTFAKQCRERALVTFENDKDSVSEWRIKSATRQPQNARSFCTLVDMTVDKLKGDLENLMRLCHSCSPPKANNIIQLLPDSFSDLVTLRRKMSSSEFGLLLSRLVQGDQIVLISASSSLEDTNFSDTVATSLGALVPPKLAEVKTINGHISQSNYAESWQFNIISLAQQDSLPKSVIAEDTRTLVVSLSEFKIISEWLDGAHFANICTLAKRLNALFDCSIVDDTVAKDITKFIALIKAEFQLESKLVYALTRLPEHNFVQGKVKSNGKTAIAIKEEKISNCAQLAPGDLEQSLFWASALSGELRRQLVQQSGGNNQQLDSAKIFTTLQDLFLT